jgi:hypothetical protein
MMHTILICLEIINEMQQYASKNMFLSPADGQSENFSVL